MATRIAAHDWAATPLGPRQAWPQRLQMAVELMLGMAQPVYIAWGDTLASFYNDGYLPILGRKHPTALGRSYHDVWPELGEPYDAHLRAVLGGESLFFENQRVALTGRDLPDSWFTFSWTPLHDDAGAIAGFLCVANETTQQVLTQHARDERADRLGLLMDASTLATREIDARGEVRADGPSWRAFTGQTEQQMHGRGWRDAIHPDDRAVTDRQWDAAIAAGTPLDTEYRLHRADGGWQWTNERAIPLRDADGRVDGWVGMNLDIQARKTAEAAWHLSDERLQAAVESADLAVWDLDLVNDRAARSLRHDRMFGYDEMQPEWGLAIAEKHILPDDLPLFREAFARALSDGVLSTEFRVRWPDGSVHRIAPLGRTHYDADGRPVRMAGVVADTTERRWSEMRYRAMFDHLDQGCVVVELVRDAQGSAVDYVALEVNPAFERVTGLSGEIAMSAPYSHLMPAEYDTWVTMFAEVSASGRSRRVHRHIAPLDRWLDVSITPVDNDRLVLFFDDITSRKRAEARQTYLLALADALRALNDAGDIQTTAARVLGEHLHADRCCYGRVETLDDGEWIVIDSDHCAPGIASVAGRHAAAPFGEGVLAQLRLGEVVVVDDVTTDPRLDDTARAVHLARGVRAWMVISLVKQGRWVGGLALHQSTPRAWTGDDVALVQETAERTWAALERAEAEAGREAAREQLARQQRFLDAMLGSLPDYAYAFGRDHRFAYTNKAMQTLFGMSGDAMLGLNFADLDYPPDLATHLDAQIAHILRTGETVEDEVFYTSPTGVSAYFHYTWGPARDEYGRVELVVGTSRDTTQRRLLEEWLRANESRQTFLMRVADTLRDLDDETELRAEAARMLAGQLDAGRVLIAERSGGHLAITCDHSRAATGLHAYPLDLWDRLGSGAFARGDMLIVDDVDTDARLFDADRRAFREAGIAAFVGRGLRDDGRVAAVMAVHAPTSRHWTTSDVSLVLDVAERTWVALQRARAQHEFRLLTEGIPQLVWRSRDGGHWLWSSPQWHALTGQSVARSRGRGWLDVVHPDDREPVLEAWSRASDDGVLDVEMRIRRAADGAWLWHHTRSLRQAGAGDAREWFGTCTDMQALKALQEQQEVLVAELQHRTRNLIGVVRSIADRTATGSASLEDFRERFRDRMAALGRVQGLLSQREAGQRVTFDQLLQAELGGLGVLDRAQLALDGPPGIGLRSSTVQTFALGLHELATNAVKYGALSAPDGRLTVRWSVEDDGRRLCVDWRESGVRIPESARRDGARRGYGRELIERALPYQLHAETHYALDLDGVHCTIRVPLRAPTELA